MNNLNLRINEKVCFTNHKNDFKEKLMKKQMELLNKFAQVLGTLLEPDEEILFAAKGCSPMSIIDQLTTGWMIYYVKRCVLIFTNKRILHFPSDVNYFYKNSLAQIKYSDIEKYKVSGFIGKSLFLEYKSGKKDKFVYVVSKELKKIKTILSMADMKGQPSQQRERHSLCPKCFAPLKKDVYICSNCRLEFKNPSKALKWSILIPGGGYFYTGHPIMGIMDAIAEGILSLMLLAGLIVLFTVGAEEVLAELVVVAIILFFEKAITIYHAQHYVKEYVPVIK